MTGYQSAFGNANTAATTDIYLQLITQLQKHLINPSTAADLRCIIVRGMDFICQARTHTSQKKLTNLNLGREVSLAARLGRTFAGPKI